MGSKPMMKPNDMIFGEAGNQCPSFLGKSVTDRHQFSPRFVVHVGSRKLLSSYRLVATRSN
jgi:hypothetical protein